MKELSIEEKAHRYDEVVERANNILEGKCKNVFVYNQYNQELIEYLFHEISEYGKIKKVLVDYFKTYKEQEECGVKTFYGIPTDKILDWLEMQGEQKRDSYENIKKKSSEQGKSAFDIIKEAQAPEKIYRRITDPDNDKRNILIEYTRTDYAEKNFIDRAQRGLAEIYRVCDITDERGDWVKLRELQALFEKYINENNIWTIR